MNLSPVSFAIDLQVSELELNTAEVSSCVLLMFRDKLLYEEFSVVARITGAKENQSNKLRAKINKVGCHPIYGKQGHRSVSALECFFSPQKRGECEDRVR